MGWVEVAAAAFQAVQAVRSYSAQQKAAKQQAAANAAAMKAAQTEAELARADAAQKAQAARDDAAKVRSQQLALYLKSGVTLDGSPMLVLDDTTAQGEKNANNIITNADYTAKSLLLKGKAAQQPVQKADFFGTAASVLGSINTAIDAYKKAYG